MIKVIFRDAMGDQLMPSLVPAGSSLRTSPSSRCMMGLCPASGLTSPQLSSSLPPTSSLACEHPNSARPKVGFITYCRVSGMQVVQRKHAQTLSQAFDMWCLTLEAVCRGSIDYFPTEVPTYSNTAYAG